MKRLLLSIIFLLISSHIEADECQTLQRSFEKEEAAYDTVARIAIAGNKSYEIIKRFVKEGETLLKQCPKSYSLDRQYTLTRKIAKAKQHQQSYRVFTQSQVRSYARTHPEEIVVYKWGTIRPVR
ncbi:MAG: hypothetical protein WBF77_01730 [Sulfurimonadaceae bacterium]